ncbi:response regulator [Dasania sp. GY-MA-18]|uniref:histidine kinase n=1 Tax=Dasania phycosphaerae TaxID=2950436 RepID=A0A9J6RG16_9GAMM|nr:MULTISPECIES: hybrid sensor histidine kinase/response regulator [Dasania]MCR8921162.1 response regulator [Dasania sp. GY-MA-18]MCZ0863590.1 response regulator [Dasania phycosphaerae]MCZ0867318.1 response regulator [Dasania phycosphaerae]
MPLTSHLIRTLWLFCALVLLIPAKALAVDLDDGRNHYNLNEDIYWFEDKSQLMTIADIIQPQNLDRFQLNQKKLFNLGFKESNVWLHLQLQRPQSQAANKEWFLSIDNPLLDHIEIYQYSQKTLTKTTVLGDLLSFEKRQVKHRSFITPLRFESNNIDLFIKITSSSVLKVPLYLFDDIKLAEQYGYTSNYYGMYFGVIFCAFIYCFFKFIKTRERFLLYGFSYILAFAFIQATLSGYAFQYLWPQRPEFNQASIILSVSLSCLFGLLTCRHFLALPESKSSFEIALNGSIALAIVLTLLVPFVSYQTALEITLMLILSASTAVFACTISSISLGDKTARLFLLAWLCMAPGIVNYCLITANYVDVGLLTETAILAGSALQVILLSLALDNRSHEHFKNSFALQASAQQQLAQQVAELETKLNHSQRASLLKDSFLATISHELRTPVNSIEGSLSLVDTNTMDQQQSHYINAAYNSAQNLTTLINSILHFSEIQAGTAKTKKESFELRPIFNRLADAFRHRCNTKNITLNWHIDKNVPNYIVSDSDQLSLILSQLVDNAIKYTEQGSITVTISTEKQQLIFSVHDTGQGINPTKLSSIIKEFQHNNSDYMRHHHDMGIGLSICHRICLLLNAELHIESTLGQGSLFTFVAPLQLPNITQPQDHSAEPNSHKEKIVLIAEDNPVNQMVLKGMLEKLDCIVLTANNGQQALDTLQQQPVDIILMDCQMPIMDGFEATKKIRQTNSAYSNVPIIAVTANAMAGDNEQCIALGMNDYIKKPINRELLAQKIQHWLREAS